MTTVVLADDHPVFRDGLRSLLTSVGIEVLGEAATGAEAVRVSGETNPDVVIMDLHMPEMNGIDATASESIIRKKMKRKNVPKPMAIFFTRVEP